MTSQGLMPARNAGLSSHRPGKLNNSKWHYRNFPGRWLLRPAFIAGIKPCDVIMHKVYWTAMSFNFRTSNRLIRVKDVLIYMRKVHYLLQLGKLAINNVKFRISASKFFLTRFPQQVLFARVYGKRLTFFHAKEPCPKASYASFWTRKICSCVRPPRKNYYGFGKQNTVLT
jgi:hypothetical protein